MCAALGLASLAVSGTACAQSAASLSAPSAPAAELTRRIAASGFAGTVLIARGDTIVYERAFGPVAPAGGAEHELGRVWRWASVSKQIAATIAMQEVAAGRLDLDSSLAAYLPDSRAPYAGSITIRQLMQHRSGLRHADDGPIDADGWPLFYRVAADSPDTGRAYCEGPTDVAPGTAFRYGDCDYIVLAAVLEAVTGMPYPELVRTRIAEPLELGSVGMFPRDEQTIPGYVGGSREPEQIRLENFGAAGALYGTSHDLWRFDRALLSGALLPERERAEMWRGDPEIGYAALGQWAFPAQLARCDASVDLIERRGAIGGVQLRNILVPSADLVVILMTNRSEADFAFGEIWQQSGLSHDMLDMLLCGREQE